MEQQDMRLDRWLWAARFFKTRGLAQEAIAGGHVHLNGQRVKPAKAVRPGDRLEISRGEERFEVHVTALAARRGPAATARALYEESESSIAAREAARQHRRDLAGSRPPAARPDKRDRRRIISFTKSPGG
ncbi:RNA-binding S4 domain-containing protein [Wenzhouxiangella sp. XN24]|uniref:RNA-binding S4 domain-containing protein n=1 Tax=Wenzhouxiangella sp. XN24 TaxID=2713569 RepID=UPI0013ECCDBC|nr:RNA-binding S4 domain-containing protein [Wenzhouxiangella sp. XN24]NGX15467.1 RNA-binding S4 domain-containing protein [Wenzhouxiangella sp. XN24]